MPTDANGPRQWLAALEESVVWASSAASLPMLGYIPAELRVEVENALASAASDGDHTSQENDGAAAAGQGALVRRAGRRDAPPNVHLRSDSLGVDAPRAWQMVVEGAVGRRSSSGNVSLVPWAAFAGFHHRDEDVRRGEKVPPNSRSTEPVVLCTALPVPVYETIRRSIVDHDASVQSDDEAIDSSPTVSEPSAVYYFEVVAVPNLPQVEAAVERQKQHRQQRAISSRSGRPQPLQSHEAQPRDVPDVKVGLWSDQAAARSRHGLEWGEGSVAFNVTTGQKERFVPLARCSSAASRASRSGMDRTESAEEDVAWDQSSNASAVTSLADCLQALGNAVRVLARLTTSPR